MSVTKNDLIKGLKKVGISNGDVIFAHSSLSAFGNVEGGADTVIDALLETVGESGTVAMPTFTYAKAFTAKKWTFDISTHPSEVGKITEVFRKRPEAIRSCHVSHSIAAIGKHASDLMGEGISPFGNGSSFDVLQQFDAWNLFLGVDLHCCTAFHVAEELCQVPYRKNSYFSEVEVVWPNGDKTMSQSFCPVKQQGFGNDFSQMIKLTHQSGILNKTTVGEATIFCGRIRNIISLVMDQVQKDPYFLANKSSSE